MGGIRISFRRLLVGCLLVVAMASASFAHAVMSRTTSPELSAYLAAGGSLAEICGDLEDRESHSGSKCEACRLIEVAAVPPEMSGARLSLTDRTRRFAFISKQLLQSRGLDPARLSRAPPTA